MLLNRLVLQSFAAVIALLLSVSLVSCDRDQLSPTKDDLNLPVSHGRVVFSSEKEYKATLEVFRKTDKLKLISENLSKNGLVSLQSYVEMNGCDTLHFPAEMYRILNKDLEYKIADTIYRYDLSRDVKYAIPEKEKEVYLKAVHGDFPGAKYVAAYFNTMPISLRSPGGRISLSSRGLDARHQKEFTQQQYMGQSVVGRRKYVHELWGYYETKRLQQSPMAIVECSLFLQIKLEWKGSQDWQSAGEARYISYLLDGNSKVITDSNPNTWDPSTNETTFHLSNFFVASGIQKVLLHKFSYLYLWADGSNMIKHSFSVDINGTISQQVVGDLASNTWNNTGNPLW